MQFNCVACVLKVIKDQQRLLETSRETAESVGD